jgi:hypothetical protein
MYYQPLTNYGPRDKLDIAGLPLYTCPHESSLSSTRMLHLSWPTAIGAGCLDRYLVLFIASLVVSCQY